MSSEQIGILYFIPFNLLWPLWNQQMYKLLSRYLNN